MKKLLLILMTLLLNFNIVNAAIRVSPSNIEIDANKTKKNYITGSFTVTGGKDELVRFKIYPVFFQYDSKGHFIELEDNNQKNSLMGKIQYYPQEFTCRDGLDQKVRFTITDLKSLPMGDSKVVLFLEDVDTKEVIIKKANGQYGGKIIVKTRVGVPIYVAKGLYSKKGSLDKLVMVKKGNDYNCECKVSSLGNSRIRYNAVAYLSQGNNMIKQYDLHGYTVEGGKFVESSQTIEIPQDQLKPDGEYKIKLVLRYEDEKQHQKVIKKELTFIPNKLQEKLYCY